MRSSVDNFPSRIALAKSEYFPTFPKNKKVTKSHFCVLAYVYDVFWCFEGSESQSCVLSALEHFGAPKSPKPHFFIRVRRFCVFGEPQKHFWRSWALLGCSELFGSPRGSAKLTDGQTELYDPGRAGSEGGPRPNHITCAGLLAFPPHSNRVLLSEEIALGRCAWLGFMST